MSRTSAEQRLRDQKNGHARDYYNRHKHKPEFRRKQCDYQKRQHYGLTIEQVEQMTADQHGRCAICNKEAQLYIDHDHETKQIRRMLCHNCNLGLGHFKDNPFLLQAAADYLKGFK